MIDRKEQSPLRLMYGAIKFMALFAVVKVGVLELLSEGPKTIKELATIEDLDADTLFSCLMVLSDPDMNVCNRNGDTFELSEQGIHFLIGGLFHAGIIMYGSSSIWDSIGELPYTLRTGKPAFEKIHGSPRFNWLYKSGNEAALENFLRRMEDISALEIPAILDAYDFSGASNILDIGAGHGDLLMGILKKHLKVRGGMFDLPKVIDSARSFIEEGLENRCSLIGGDFFKSLPTGYNLMICKRITHDWTLEKALRLLKNCFEHMPPNGKLLLMERAHGEGSSYEISNHLSNLYMRMITGGRERSPQELSELVEQAGFEGILTIPTNSQIVIIEGTKPV